MEVSVVLCTYAMDTYPHFREAAESVLAQTHDGVELVVVVDGTEDVYDRALAEFGDREGVTIHCNEENLGLAASRNAGVELASGDVVAFVDDDAVADERWVAELVSAYEEQDALAVGGRMAPLWVAGKPDYLPAEFYWLVGVTHRGFADGPGEVRNTFGSNISFRRDVFGRLGGFDPEFGRRGEKNLQAEETELAVRLHREFGERVWYTPRAVVHHKVFDYRTDPKWLLDRAFWQGYSKRAMAVLLPDSGDEESAFLGDLLTRYVPQRLVGLPFSGVAGLLQLLFLAALTVAVGVGYLYALPSWR
jgi:glycosyltransferase involved in cell wall biosynthesis